MPKTVEPKRSDDKRIVSLKVALRGTRPPVWRRLLMPGTMTLADLHQAIQAAMGWEDCHLHVFDIAGRRYGDRHTVDDVADEKRPTLNSLVKSGVARFAYT
jgi:Plasmid pRiA4b ORF-3-like protein